MVCYMPQVSVGAAECGSCKYVQCGQDCLLYIDQDIVDGEDCYEGQKA